MKTQHTKDNNRKWRSLFRTIKNLHLPWIWVALGLFLNLGLSHLLLKLPDTTADLMSGELTGSALWNAVLYYIILGLLSMISVAGQAQAQSYSVKCARESVWKKMLRLKMSFYDTDNPSDLMSAITNDTNSAVTDVVNVIIYLIPNIYYVVMALLKINQYHWVLAAACFAILPIKCLYVFVMGRRFEVGTAQIYSKIGRLTGFLADRIAHLPLIKAYTNEQAESDAGEKAAFKLMKANMKLVHLDNIALGITELIGVLQKCAVVIVAVVLLQQEKIDMAMWLGFFLFSQSLFSYMDQIFDVWLRLKSIQGTFWRVITIMDSDEEAPEAPLSSLPQGDIRFNNVTFTYPETDTPALNQVSLVIPRGTSAAIVGLCGSGKTTTISLLERLYTPDEGAVLIGDTDIRDISLDEFRRHISYVQQGAGIFSGTLREALTYGISRSVTDEEIMEAARQTGFNDYLALCNNNLDTEIASDGTSLSGGQNQRLVLTRELLRNGDILLLDEPTAALDVHVSAKIQETIDRVFADKTRLLVTHDLSLAKSYNTIFVMSNGKLVGSGTHEDLLSHCAAYRDMNSNTKEAVTV